jgi:hypothetical protein
LPFYTLASTLQRHYNRHAAKERVGQIGQIPLNKGKNDESFKSLNAYASAFRLRLRRKHG